MIPIDFWVSIGSTYSYLSVMRAAERARAAGADLRWRPFNVRTIMTEQNNIPFKDKPVKAAYMWRDLERRAAMYGLPARLPAPYPLPELELANRVAVLGMQEGWGEAYVTHAYRLWFQDGLPPGEEPNLGKAIAAAGADPEPAVRIAEGEAIGQALADATQEAMNTGVFGAPTFVVNGEVFWGDDRMEDALSWAAHGRVIR